MRYSALVGGSFRRWCAIDCLLYHSVRQSAAVCSTLPNVVCAGLWQSVVVYRSVWQSAAVCAGGRLGLYAVDCRSMRQSAVVYGICKIYVIIDVCYGKIYAMVDICYGKIYVMLSQYVRSSIKQYMATVQLTCIFSRYFRPPFCFFLASDSKSDQVLILYVYILQVFQI